MTDMLKAVVVEGTGQEAMRIGRPLAGKTGTTDGYKDAFFIGFSPTVVAGVWVGLDNHGTMGDKETGARAALPIWIHFMDQVLRGRLCHDFDLPEGVVQVRIDASSGFLATKDCPNAVTALFKKGTGPKRRDRQGSERQFGGL
jgi:penicillin-binding protein 1A